MLSPEFHFWKIFLRNINTTDKQQVSYHLFNGNNRNKSIFPSYLINFSCSGLFMHVLLCCRFLVFLWYTVWRTPCLLSNPLCSNASLFSWTRRSVSIWKNQNIRSCWRRHQKERHLSVETYLEWKRRASLKGTEQKLYLHLLFLRIIHC